MYTQYTVCIPDNPLVMEGGSNLSFAGISNNQASARKPSSATFPINTLETNGRRLEQHLLPSLHELLLLLLLQQPACLSSSVAADAMITAMQLGLLVSTLSKRSHHTNQTPCSQTA